MEEQSNPIKPIALNFGIYTGLLSIASLVILYALDIESNWIISILSTLGTIIIYYFGISSYKKLNSNVLRIRNGLKCGMGIALVGGIISAIYAAFHYTFLLPEFLEGKKIEATEAMMTQNPNIEGEELEMALKFIDISTSEFSIVTMMVLGSLFFGFIVSLIISAILKNN